jgi:hypothetical protein
MDAQLRGLIDEYLAAIREALSLFRTHKGLEPDAVMCWREQDELAQQIGYVDATGKIPFFFHGIGCAVHLPAGAVDWDFGHGGRFDGYPMALWPAHDVARPTPESTPPGV